MKSLYEIIHDVRICEVKSRSNKIKYCASRINDALQKLSVIASDLLTNQDPFRDEIDFEIFCYYYKVVTDALQKTEDITFYTSDINNIRNAFTHDHIKIHINKKGILIEDSNNLSGIYYNHYYMRDDGYIDFSKFIILHVILLIKMLSVDYNESFFSGLTISNATINDAIETIDKLIHDSEIDITQYDEYLIMRGLIFKKQPSIEDLLKAKVQLQSRKDSIYRIELFHALKYLGFLYLQKNDLCNAEEYLFEAEKIIIPIAQEIPYMDNYRYELYNLLAVLLKEQKNPECIRYAEKALENVEGINRKTLLERYIALANAYAIANDKNEIDTIYKCLAILREATEQEIDGLRQARAILMNNLLAASTSHKQEVIENILTEILDFQNDSSVLHENRAKICWNLAKYYMGMQNFSEAEKKFKLYLKLCKEITEYDQLNCNIYIAVTKIMQGQKNFNWDKLMTAILNSSIDSQKKEYLSKWLTQIIGAIQ